MLNRRTNFALTAVFLLAFPGCEEGTLGDPDTANYGETVAEVGVEPDAPATDATATDVAGDPAEDGVGDATQDTRGEPDADLPPDLTETGDPCREDSECASGFCQPGEEASGVCAVPCEPECLQGWACLDGECACEPTREVCDGGDNDCDGVVDEGAANRLGCDFGEACDDGACNCVAPSAVCDGVCEDLETSRVNCGGCDVRCPGGDICSGAVCVCSGGRERCESGCSDTFRDPLNCGGCGVECPSGVCIEGLCACADGDLTCETGCADLLSDPSNCGECGFTCSADEICRAGECECGCPDGTCDDGSCVPLIAGSPTTIEFELSGEPRRTDLVFNIDVTGSMGPSIDTLALEFSDGVVPLSRARAQDPAFALTGFADFPCIENDSGGSSRDLPMRLYQRVTTLPDLVRSELLSMRAGGGRDIPETGIEALFQIATGLGTDQCRIGLVPPFDPNEARLDEAADGELGGVGFRAGAHPIVFHLTDAPTHARESDQYKFGATEEEAVEALEQAGVRVVGLFMANDAREDLEFVISATGAAAPVCAWDGVRSTACGVDQCCTGLRMAGRPPTEAGLCPLGYQAGVGLLETRAAAEMVSDAIRVLNNHVGRTAVATVVPDPAALELGIDTTCLAERLQVVGVSSPGECRPTTSLDDLDEDGTFEAANGVSGASTVRVEASLVGDCVTLPGSYALQVQLVGTDGTLLGSETIHALVR